jgi:hypothetical protein
MRQFPFFLLAALLLPVKVYSQDLPSAPQPVAPSNADEEAWDRLSFVEGDTEVFVQSRRGTTRCESLSVTEGGLSCQAYVVFGSSRTTRVSRSEVLSVRERVGDSARWIALAAGTAGGFAWAHSWNRPAQHGIDGVLVGAFFGYAAWKLSPIAQHFLPGRTLYRRQQHPTHPNAE